MSIDLLIEKYIGRVPGMGGHYKKMSCEIFLNPSSKEMRDASHHKKLRFIAHGSKKDLYVWRYDGSYHGDVHDEYIGGGEGVWEFKNMWGIIKLDSGKWIMTRSDSQEDHIHNVKDVTKIVNRFKWLENYNIDVKTWLTDAGWRNENNEWE
jgi:hypothetical protein